MFFQMYQALISINDLFQVNILVYDVYKGVFCIIFLIHTNDFFQRYFGLDYQRREDTTSEISTVRNKVDVRIEAVLQLFQRLISGTCWWSNALYTLILLFLQLK